jgi:hypothetical protein
MTVGEDLVVGGSVTAFDSSEVAVVSSAGILCWLPDRSGLRRYTHRKCLTWIFMIITNDHGRNF